MAERRVTRMQVIRCLRHGMILEGPIWSMTKGNWECRMHHIVAGDSLTVGLAIDLDENVVIVTVFR